MNNLVDLHTHSVLSKHAYSSITENIDAAIETKLKYLGLSEHQSDPQGVGAHIYAFANLSIVPREYKGLKILRGIEFNILNDKPIDKTNLKLKDLDYGIASIHAFCYSDAGYIGNTENVLRALEDKEVLILGHLDRGFYEMDYEKIISRCKQLHKLIEINDASLFKLSEENFKKAVAIMNKMLAICEKYKQPIIMNSDAHIKYHVGKIDSAIKVVEEAEFPPELILNYNENLLLEYFKV